jgi:hypothetical protein
MVMFETEPVELAKSGRVGKHHQWRSGSYIVTQGCDL